MGKAIPYIFYITLFLFIFALCLTYSNYDFDLWARLIAGMGVVDGGQVLKADFLSYTPTHTWWDHEWGSGVIFYLILKYLGPFWLVILHVLLFFGIFFFISKTVKLREKACPYNVIFYIFGIFALTENFDAPVRCHMFSFLLFSIFFYILELSRRGKNKPLYFIPLLVILWNNLHGGVVAGLGLIGIYALGEFLNKKPVKKYLIILAISLAVLIINPWGWEYIKFLLMANTMQRHDVAEWWGSFSKFHLFLEPYFKLYLAITAITEIWTAVKNKSAELYKNADKVKLITLFITLYLAISHVKLIPFFVIASMVFVYEDFYRLISQLKFPQWKDKAIYGLILALSLISISVKEISIPLDFNQYPVKEVEFIKLNNLKGRLLTNFGVGSYTAYKLYPNNLIFMDGRYEEVYYDGMVQMLKKFYLVNTGWDEILHKFPPNVMIIENFYPIYKVLKNSKDWKVVYEGRLYGVFVPRKSSKAKYIQPSDDIEYYRNNLFKTSIKF